LPKRQKHKGSRAEGGWKSNHPSGPPSRTPTDGHRRFNRCTRCRGSLSHSGGATWLRGVRLVGGVFRPLGRHPGLGRESGAWVRGFFRFGRFRSGGPFGGGTGRSPKNRRSGGGVGGPGRGGLWWWVDFRRAYPRRVGGRPAEGLPASTGAGGPGRPNLTRWSGVCAAPPTGRSGGAGGPWTGGGHTNPPPIDFTPVVFRSARAFSVVAGIKREKGQARSVTEPAPAVQTGGTTARVGSAAGRGRVGGGPGKAFLLSLGPAPACGGGGGGGNKHRARQGNNRRFGWDERKRGRGGGKAGLGRRLDKAPGGETSRLGGGPPGRTQETGFGREGRFLLSKNS